MTFWNKVQSGVSRAAAEAEKQARSARINLAIGDVENTTRRHKQELADKALELVRAGTVTDATLVEIVGRIDQQDEKLTDLRKELGEVQNPSPASAEPTPKNESGTAGEAAKADDAAETKAD